MPWVWKTVAYLDLAGLAECTGREDLRDAKLGPLVEASSELGTSAEGLGRFLGHDDQGSASKTEHCGAAELLRRYRRGTGMDGEEKSSI